MFPSGSLIRPKRFARAFGGTAMPCPSASSSMSLLFTPCPEKWTMLGSDLCSRSCKSLTCVAKSDWISNCLPKVLFLIPSSMSFCSLPSFSLSVSRLLAARNRIRFNRRIRRKEYLKSMQDWRADCSRRSLWHLRLSGCRRGQSYLPGRPNRYVMPDSPPELGGLSREKFIYISTTGRITGKTHTVELWFAWSNGKVYLSHEGEQTDWMKNIQKNPV